MRGIRCSGSSGGPNCFLPAANLIAIVKPTERKAAEPDTKHTRPHVRAASWRPKRFTVDMKRQQGARKHYWMRHTRVLNGANILAIRQYIRKAVEKVFSGNAYVGELHPTVVDTIQPLTRDNQQKRSR